MPGKMLWSFLSIPTTSVQTRKAAPAERGRDGDTGCCPLSAGAQVAGGAQAEVDGAVQCEEQHQGEAGDDRVGREEIPEVPVNSCADETGTPWRRLENAMPQISGIPTEAIAFTHVQTRRHAPLWALPRHSNETMRVISRTSSRSSAT